MNRNQKQAQIENLHEEFGRTPHAIVVDFRGLTVPAVTEFRRKVRQSGSRYRVVKNSLATRALKGTPLEKLTATFEGTTGVVYSGADPVALAKVLVDFAKDHPSLVVKAGLVAGDQLLDPEGVKALSTMPSLREGRSRLLGMFNGPASRLVRLLEAPASKLVRLLHAKAAKQAGE
jgi:large subunit ribosomal protein L10